jgi:hypothetical protein
LCDGGENERRFGHGKRSRRGGGNDSSCRYAYAAFCKSSATWSRDPPPCCSRPRTIRIKSDGRRESGGGCGVLHSRSFTVAKF